MKPFAWSYSALVRFESCPKQYWHLNVEKDFKDVDSEMSREGKAIHDALFRRVMRNVPLPVPMRHFEPMALKFSRTAGEMHGEMKLALNRDLDPVDFFAPDVWVRAIVDLMISKDSRAIVVDWKTGKPKDDFTQMGLAAAVLSQWMPELTEFRTVYVWLKHRKLSPKIYTKESLSDVWSDLLPRANRVEEARNMLDFPARPSPLCGYCPVTSCPHHFER